MPKFSQALFNDICAKIAEGKSLRSICKSKDMPNKSTFMDWLNKDGELADHYARARTEQADHIFDEILEIVDEASAEEVQQARLRMDARKWMAGKMNPKKYGEKIDHNHRGALTVTLESDADEL